MNGRYVDAALRFAAILLCGVLSTAVSFSQDDPDPNSPTPVLVTSAKTARPLTAESLASAPQLSIRGSRGQVTDTPVTEPPSAFSPGSEVTLVIANVQLLPDEGAGAFRAYARDEKGHYFRFPVLEISASRLKKFDFYNLKIKLTDELGFWEVPSGDLAFFVTWRGLASNEALLGYGITGGGVTLSADAAPMPPEKAQAVVDAARKPSVRTKGARINAVGYIWSGDRRRFEEQAAFGPTTLLDNRIRRIGLRVWLAEQMNDDYASYLSRYPNQPLKPGTAPADCDGDQTVTPDVPSTCFRDTYTMYPIQQWSSKEMLYSDNQLRHRVAWALSQIWVTSGQTIQQSRHMVEYHKILSANAFGNFRTLMQQMTLNPAMGDYLDMAASTKNNPNENYARELMQLFTVGLVMLNTNGTIQCVEHNPCQTGDTPIPTYDQNVVNNMTKVMTGWTYCQNSNLAVCPNYVSASTTNYIDPLLLNTNNHDLTAKTLLSYPGSTTTNIAACTNCTTTANTTTYANNSLNQALDNIFYHPNVGPFIATRLIQQMVESDPTPAYVGRVAAVFNDNGAGVRGDMKAVIKAILLDPEARGDAKTDPGYGKLREPMQFSVNYLRAFNAMSVDRTTQSDGVIFLISQFTGMSQSPYRSPSVFNYYPPTFVIPGTSTVGPEFALMTTGTSISRANFINQMTYGNPAIPVSAASNSGGAPNGTSIDLSDLQTLSNADSTGGQLVDELNTRLLHGTMSSQMRSQTMTAVQAVSPTDSLARSRAAVYLVATSSQYQVQR